MRETERSRARSDFHLSTTQLPPISVSPLGSAEGHSTPPRRKTAPRRIATTRRWKAKTKRLASASVGHGVEDAPAVWKLAPFDLPTGVRTRSPTWALRENDPRLSRSVSPRWASPEWSLEGIVGSFQVPDKIPPLPFEETTPRTKNQATQTELDTKEDNLIDAERKAQKAQETSQLSSDSEHSDSDMCLLSKRKKKLPARYRINSDDEDTEKQPKKQRADLANLNNQIKRPIVPAFPQVQDTFIDVEETSQLGSISENSNFETSLLSKPKNKLPARRRINSDNEITEKQSKRQRVDLVNLNNQTKCPIVSSFSQVEDSTVQAVEENLQINSQIVNCPVTTETVSSEQISTEVVEIVTRTNEEVNRNTKKSNNQTIKEILTMIFKLIEEVKFEVIESKKEQQQIKIRLDSLVIANSTVASNKFSQLLPISSMETFDEIQYSLTNCDEDWIAFLKYLNLASGQTVKELVPSVMKLLMKKAVSIQFSGCGRRNKRNFSATKIAAAVN
ncbi:PREDICTED: uncharacterized protein LOC105455834, partial [Wasmannia auropunctata]|uniref:uncharacterized protein LOC105455834 n=1 Tax=Wasmannia auropunctata TaxID=64793 RepID=UPI0005EE59B1